MARHALNDHIPDGSAARQMFMRICAEATETELEQALAACGSVFAAEDVRAPETGLVMLRGRIGGDGAPFNIGEATVTRAVIRLTDGTLGYAYCLGRSERRARGSPPSSTLWANMGSTAPGLTRCWSRRCGRGETLPGRQAGRETAATRVNFFTLVRGED